jgi:hypothetical protein
VAFYRLSLAADYKVAFCRLSLWQLIIKCFFVGFIVIHCCVSHEELSLLYIECVCPMSNLLHRVGFFLFLILAT